MPVKMMPSERRTAIQLSSPPTIAALAVPTATPAAIGSDVWSVRIAAPYPPTPASAPTQRKSWLVLPKIRLNPTPYAANTIACTASDVV